MSVLICKTCGSQNAPQLTFCQDCGGRLLGYPAPPTPSVDALAGTARPYHPEQATPAAEGAPRAFHPIQPTPMVDVGPRDPHRPSSSRVCLRCRGISDAGAQFCKFCGATLADGLPVANPPAALSPAPPPPSSAQLPPIPSAPVPIVAAPQMPLPVLPIVSVPSAPSQARPDVFHERPAVTLQPAPGLAPPPPASAQRAFARLTSVAKDGSEKESYPFTEVTDIGRTEGDITFSEDRYLSPRHARVFVREGKIYLQDLASANGTFQRLKPGSAPLEDQDLLLVGQQVIRFEVVNRDEWPTPAVQHGTLLFGTPSTKPYARICQRGVEGIDLNVYYLRANETVLGRELGDIVFTDDPFMSRRHAVIARQGTTGAVTISDVGSSNGTFLRIRRSVELGMGDEFRLGQQLFRVTHGEAAS